MEKRRKARQKKRLEDDMMSGQGWILPAQIGQVKDDKVERVVAKTSVVPQRPTRLKKTFILV